MIDAKDKQTVDAFKKRGRPALKGEPMTAAERKRRQRQRALDVVREATKAKAFDAVSMTALMTELEAAVRHGDLNNVKLITAELTKRAKDNKK